MTHCVPSPVAMHSRKAEKGSPQTMKIMPSGYPLGHRDVRRKKNRSQRVNDATQQIAWGSFARGSLDKLLQDN